MRTASLALVLVAIAGAVSAQQLYRWTDEKGRVHVTDSPPPGNARDVQKKAAPATGGPAQQLPAALTEAMKNYPVTLYTAPQCKKACDMAREILNRRGVPFTEVQVWEDGSDQELRQLTGDQPMVPTIKVGKSVQKGFLEEQYDALLDSAQYPKAGVAPVRSQKAPPPPKDFVDPTQVKAEPVEPPAPKGRYAPKAPAKPEAEAPRRYAPIPGKDETRTGPYGKPAEDAAPKN